MDALVVCRYVFTYIYILALSVDLLLPFTGMHEMLVTEEVTIDQDSR